jgi:hypothetical protein
VIHFRDQALNYRRLRSRQYMTGDKHAGTIVRFEINGMIRSCKLLHFDVLTEIYFTQAAKWNWTAGFNKTESQPKPNQASGFFFKNLKGNRTEKSIPLVPIAHYIELDVLEGFYLSEVCNHLSAFRVSSDVLQRHFHCHFHDLYNALI